MGKFKSYATWELQNMKSAKMMLRALNTEDEERELKEIIKELRTRKR